MKTKEQLKNDLQNAIMLNAVAPTSQTLQALFAQYDELIQQSEWLQEKDKIRCRQNLQKAYVELRIDLIGYVEDGVRYAR